MTSPDPAKRSLRYCATITACFLALISIPLLLTVSNLARGVGTERDEAAAPSPKMPASLGQAVRWPSAFKRYFQERFGLRSSLASLHGSFKVNVLDTTASSAVLLGKGGRLFLKQDRVLDYQRHSEPLSPEQLQQWAQALAERHRDLQKRGIRYAFMPVPSAHSVYPEALPDGLAAPAPETRLDQLAKATLALAPDFTFVDLRPTLRQHKHDVPIFFLTDTHWTAAGAWLGATELARRLNVTPPPTPLFPLRVTTTPIGGDLARLLGLASDYTDSDVWPAAAHLPLLDDAQQPTRWKLKDVVGRDRVVANNAAGQGTAVVFRDSFGEALIPWISSMFKRTIWIWSYAYLDDVVREERPDVVIEEMVEYKLMVVKSPGGGLSE